MKIIIYFFSFWQLSLFLNIFDNGDYIYWDEQVKLSWNDFKGKPNPDFKGNAQTHCSISYTASFENDSLIFNVTCYFDKTKSWVKEGKLSDNLLIHEQLHFDIFELYARKIRKRMFSQDLTLANMQSELENTFKTLYKECKEEQNSYDKETDHSINADIQGKWLETIKEEIRNLSEYSRSRYKRTLN